MSRNPTRGCGKKKKGGFYLEAPLGPHGTLAPLTWVLGTHVVDGRSGRNVLTQAAQRSMTMINPAATLLKGEVAMPELLSSLDISDGQLNDMLDCGVKPGIADRLSGRVGELGILDYVGSNNYTPWSFAMELLAYGPSRKVTKDFMRQIAPYLPLPVFFTMKGLPFFSKEGELSLAWLDSIDADRGHEATMSLPTWWHDDWGMGARHYNGDDHMVVDILAAMANGLLLDFAPGEAVFCASWFTQGTYCKLDGDDPGVDMVNVENLDLDALDEEE